MLVRVEDAKERTKVEKKAEGSNRFAPIGAHRPHSKRGAEVQVIFFL